MKIPRRFKAPEIWPLSAACAFILPFQNCTGKTFFLSTPSSDSAKSGDDPTNGYGGKLFVNHGDCGTGTVNEKSAILIKDGSNEAQLVIDNCVKLASPSPLSPASIRYSARSKDVLIYDEAIYDLQQSDPAKQHLTYLACFARSKGSEAYVWGTAATPKNLTGELTLLDGALVTGYVQVPISSSLASLSGINYSGTDATHGDLLSLLHASSGDSSATYTVNNNFSGSKTDLVCSTQAVPPVTYTYAWFMSDFSPCSTAAPLWTAGVWSTCNGAANIWNYSAWSGCGGGLSSAETRTRLSCAANTGNKYRNYSCAPTSGVQNRTVVCKRSDGEMMDDLYCASAAKPALQQSCQIACSTPAPATETSACSLTCVDDSVGISRACAPPSSSTPTPTPSPTPTPNPTATPSATPPATPPPAATPTPAPSATPPPKTLQARYPTTCADIQNAIRYWGAATVYQTADIYDRFVYTSAYCPSSTVMTATTIATYGNANCPVNYCAAGP